MDSHAAWSAGNGVRAVRFTGNWREFLPIAVTNALLIICTLGVYRFWAAARQRRYLWSRTYLIDDALEWTGTGKEMFFGFLIVIAVLAPFFLFIQFLLPALAARGNIAGAAIAMLLFYAGLIYFAGLARFRALRYRLSRTWWHGIRGGSDNPGWGYGGEYLGRYALVALTLFILFPWAATRLWNSRWNAMSFGPLEFRSKLNAEGLIGRWALIYTVPFVFAFVTVLAGIGAGGAFDPDRPPAGFLAVIGIAVLLFYLAIPLLTLHWFAAFYRNAAANTSLGDLDFSFDATTWDWLKLFLGNIGLAIVTLGFGLTYWGYRSWSFMVRHMHVHGEVDVSALTQSRTAAPREAEGFADAFDVGAI